MYAQPAWQLATWRVVGTLPEDQVDVVVMGGGLSGCAAAVAAARRGVRVVLVEPTHLLGGQMSAAAVGASDIWSNTWHICDQGLWGEFVRRTNRIYTDEMHGKATNTNGYQKAGFAASATVVDRVWSEMLFEAGVEVVRSCAGTVTRLTSDGAKITVPGGATLRCSVVVEATEDGSVLAQTRLPYRIGNTVVAAGGSPPSGPALRIQDITCPIVIRRYEGGVPDALRLTAPPEGYQTVRGGIARWYPHAPWSDASDPRGFAGFRGLPDLATDTSYDATQYAAITRTSLNYLNDVAVSAEFLTDPAYRLARTRKAINVSLAILYYLQVELGLPWALCTDEGFADGPATPERAALLQGFPDLARHLPLIPYLRESRRLVGATTMSQASVGRTLTSAAPWLGTTVAVGTYPFDLHGAFTPNEMETELGETEVPKERSGAFPIPFEALVPADDSRLVAAEKNLSMSRLVNGSVRTHPSVTAVGQAAGVVAAGSAKLKVPPRQVPVTAVQVALIEEGALVLPAPLHDSISVVDRAALSMALVRNDPVAMVDPKTRALAVPAARIPSLMLAGARLVAEAGGRI